MTIQWSREEDPGTGAVRWVAPVGDGSISVELFDDEADTFPPLVRARRVALMLADWLDEAEATGKGRAHWLAVAASALEDPDV